MDRDTGEARGNGSHWLLVSCLKQRKHSERTLWDRWRLPLREVGGRGVTSVVGRCFTSVPFSIQHSLILALHNWSVFSIHFSIALTFFYDTDPYLAQKLWCSTAANWKSDISGLIGKALHCWLNFNGLVSHGHAHKPCFTTPSGQQIDSGRFRCRQQCKQKGVK